VKAIQHFLLVLNQILLDTINNPIELAFRNWHCSAPSSEKIVDDLWFSAS
jgi:hypothetical protein